MIDNYLKIAVRNIGKHKGYSFITISGLALGMALCIITALWVYHELNYDGFHENAGDIYRVITVYQTGGTPQWAVTPGPLAPALKKEFPEIVDTVRFYPAGNWLLQYGEKAFYEPKGMFTDPSVFTIFTFPLVKGDRERALSHPQSIILTETMAAKYFGSENPMGKTIRVDHRHDFSITGVMKDIPQNSHLQFDFVVPLPLPPAGRDDLTGKQSGFYSYVWLRKNTRAGEFSHKMSPHVKTPSRDAAPLFYLQRLRDIHPYSGHLRGDVPGGVDITYIYLFSAVAFIFLVMVCINFMNLTAARGAGRSKEVGIRKVVGAERTGIIKQFFSESFLLAFFALIPAAILVELLLPVFNRLMGKQLISSWPGNPFIFPVMLVVTVVTGTMAGSYPALLLSSFQPVNALKGLSIPGTRARGVLAGEAPVIFQFSLSVILLVVSMGIYRQLDYIRNKPAYFEKEILAAMMRSEKRVLSICLVLTILAIFIACVGLYGLSAFQAEQRAREIGIRKVLGASWTDVWRLFLREFMKWIITANLVAWPMAYLLLENLYMRNYAHRVAIGPWPFITAGVLTSVIALLTVGFQAFKATATTPIEALRRE